jgi:hypothetical protein
MGYLLLSTCSAYSHMEWSDKIGSRFRLESNPTLFPIVSAELINISEQPLLNVNALLLSTALKKYKVHTFEKNMKKWQTQEEIYGPYDGHCNIWHYDSPILFYNFFPQKVWKAFNVWMVTRNNAAFLYSNDDRTKWIFHFPWNIAYYTLGWIRCGQSIFLKVQLEKFLCMHP